MRKGNRAIFHALAVYLFGSETSKSNWVTRLMLSSCWAQNHEEVKFLRDRLLTTEWGYLEPRDQYLSVFPKGWSALEEASNRPGTIDSECFVAMCFDDEMDPLLRDVIIPGARAAGYEARCLKSAHHNNNIHDEILAGVRRAKFVIADFTEQRGGVYFEAGFALGQGKQVIYLVRKGEKGESPLRQPAVQLHRVVARGSA